MHLNNRKLKINYPQMNAQQQGQSLVTLLIFMAIAIIITTTAIAMAIINSQANTKYALGEEAYHVAEAGIENAILRLLRNPNYMGEVLAVGKGTATITVSGAATKTIISEGKVSGLYRKIEVIGTFSNNSFVINSWREVD